MTTQDSRISSLNNHRDYVTQWAIEKGWYKKGETLTNDQVGTKLMLAVGELSEALEEIRAHHEPTEIYYTKSGETGALKPEGFPIEIVDTLIRLFELAGSLGIDLDYAFFTKMTYNEKRPFRHGGKAV